jgi:NADH dehydrogenase
MEKTKTTHKTLPSRTGKHVVIVGAGFSGLSTALRFGEIRSQAATAEDFRVTLIDQNDYQLFAADLYEIASAASTIAHENELRDTVCLDLRLALRQKLIDFMIAMVTGIDRQRKVVQTTKGEVPYDYLVLATGSVSHDYGIPGIREFAIPFKTIDDAIRIRETIYGMLDQKDQVHVIICGAGPAGVELATEIRNACEHSNRPKCFAATIVEGSDKVLPMLNPKAREVAEKRLKELGIRVRTNFFIAKAEADGVVSKEGETIAGDIIIWTGGVKANPILEKTGLKLGKRGQVPVKRTLQSQEDEAVFAVGDAAEVPLGEGKFAIMTAHEAVQQGPAAANNIVRLLKGEEPKEYLSEDLGFVVTLGGKNGIYISPRGRIVSGMMGWWWRKRIDFRHFRSVLPFMQACSVWYRGTRLMLKND